MECPRCGCDLDELEAVGCEYCGSPFEPQTSKGRFCSATCRVAAFRARKREELAMSMNANVLIGRLLADDRPDDELAVEVIGRLLQAVISRPVMVGDRLVVAVHEEAHLSEGLGDFARRLRSRAMVEGQVDHAAGWDGSVPMLLLGLADLVSELGPEPPPVEATGWHGNYQKGTAR